MVLVLSFKRISTRSPGFLLELLGCILLFSFVFTNCLLSNGLSSSLGHPSDSVVRTFRAFVGIKKTPKSMVFYFPQYHPIPENDKFWGEGFTEWDNVRKLQRSRNPYFSEATILPPNDVGMYDLRNVSLRRYHGELASRFDLGFIFYHYWFDEKPVMDMILQSIKKGGEPNAPFALCWANENWSKRWDGGNNDLLLEQKYNVSESRAHYDYLKELWLHPNHVRNPNGAIPFFIYVVSGSFSQDLSARVLLWRKWAHEEGFEIHIIQMLASPNQKPPECVQDWVDGVGEFWPAYSQFKGTARHHRCHYRGTYAGWNSVARHVADGAGTWSPRTLSDFAKSVRSMLTNDLSDPNPPHCLRTRLIASWNEYGEGNVLEPTLQKGDSMLRVLQAENRVIERHHHGSSFHSPRVCVVVRTYQKHTRADGSGLSPMERLMENMLQWNYTQWEAVVVDTDYRSEEKPWLRTWLQGSDPRFQAVDVPAHLSYPYDGCLSAYVATDWAVRHCSSETEWLLVTNGDNGYGSRVLDEVPELPQDVDIFLMNFVTRYFRWNHYSNRGISPDCSYDEMAGAEPDLRLGHMDLGGLLLRWSRVLDEEVFFSHHYPKTCSALDYALVMQQLKEGWKSQIARPSTSVHDLFMHNPNPYSCTAEGGVWVDSGSFPEMDCISQGEANMHQNKDEIKPVVGRFGTFNCLAINRTGARNQIEMNGPNREGAHMAKRIANDLLQVVDKCGVALDFSGTESDWIDFGFWNSSEYRFLRTPAYTAAKWKSPDCFLPRAIVGEKVLKMVGTCPSREASLPLPHTQVLDACGLDVDVDHYLEMNPDVRDASGENLQAAREHFWGFGISEGRSWKLKFVRNIQDTENCRKKDLLKVCRSALKQPSRLSFLALEHARVCGNGSTSLCFDRAATGNLHLEVSSCGIPSSYVGIQQGLKVCLMTIADSLKYTNILHGAT